MKKENLNLCVMLGNCHSTFNAERILGKYPDVDVAVRGEGEEARLELATCIRKERSSVQID